VPTRYEKLRAEILAGICSASVFFRLGMKGWMELVSENIPFSAPPSTLDSSRTQQPPAPSAVLAMKLVLAEMMIQRLHQEAARA